jgi:adenylosuccinate lyase
MIAPDTTVTLDFALGRLTGLIDKLVVYPERMQANLDSLGGLVHSQQILLALTQAGMSREDAYQAVQRHAMASWQGGGAFRDLLAGDPAVTRFLDADALARLFDLGQHLRHVDTIFRRVFGTA